MAITTTAPAAFERVYIWERPVRLYHWVTVVSMLTLIATGLIVGRPPAFMTTGDASASQWFGTVRFVHFAAGYVFLFALVIRIYWMFVGNQYARWYNFFPLTPTLARRKARDVVQVMKVDILQIQKEPIQVKGHNAMASLTYAVVFLVSMFQIVTGFGLYARDERRVAAAALRLGRADDGRRRPRAHLASSRHLVLRGVHAAFTSTSRCSTTSWKRRARSPRWSAARSSSTATRRQGSGT